MDKKIVLMVGGNDPSLAEKILKALESEKENITIYELTDDEMKAISEKRRIAAQSEAVVDFIESDENKERALSIASQFHQMFFEKNDGKFIRKSEVKNATTFSWKKFDEIIATLDIYGHVEYLDEKKGFIRIVIDEETVIKNKKKEIQKSMDFVKGLLIELQGRIKKKADRDKIETLKKRMILTV